ncbi:MAG: nuclear transport factor 2 family protein [Chitinophagales bacterium]
MLFSVLLVDLSFSQPGKPTNSGKTVSKRKVTVTFLLDLSNEMKNVKDISTIGIRGSVLPLSWEKTYAMSDKNHDHVYEATVTFEIITKDLLLEYKFMHDNSSWEETDNRVLTAENQVTVLKVAQWNDGPAKTMDQHVKDSIEQRNLYYEIAFMDSVLFEAYNTQNIEKVKTIFDEDLEFYHDKGGLTSYDQNIKSLQENFAKGYNVQRRLVKGTLEVYPVKDYGAMEIGAHEFCHVENGEMDCGTFKFLMIWQKKEGVWKITRVASYDH